ncbi:MAG: TetR/AcrR family transcriptional regulator [Marmoricola sp.]
MKMTRTYNQTARARAAEETGLRIIRSAFELQTERLTTEISLEDVAIRAGVSVQTVLRRFGSKAELFQASLELINSDIAEERRAPSGDVPGAVRVLVDHYEKHGDFALLMLAQEGSYDHVRQMSEMGKKMHRNWVAEVFGPFLPTGAEPHDAAIDLLVIATDVYTWKLMRRDRGLSRDRTEQRINSLVTAVLAGITSAKEH